MSVYRMAYALLFHHYLRSLGQSVELTREELNKGYEGSKRIVAVRDGNSWENFWAATG
jgi:hypothetical protein